MNEITPRQRWKFGLWVGIAVLIVLTFVLRGTLFPLFIAFALSYACSPLVDYLERRGAPRTAIVLGLLFVIIGGLCILIAVIVPAVFSEMHDFVRDFPDFATTALRRVSELAARFGIQVPSSAEALIARFRASAGDASMSALSPVVLAAKRIFSGAGSVLLGFLNLLIIPIFFFYAVRDLHKAQKYVFGLIPPRHRPRARSLFERIDKVFSGYIRGQLLVASILAVAFGIALPLLGVRFGLFIGILAGFLNIIPYLGQITGLALSLMMAFVDFSGFGRIVGILAVFAVMNFIEGNFITPKVVGDKVGLSPLWAIIALIIGGSTGGLTGMVLAIPLAGTIRIILQDVLAAYRRSSYYNDPKG